MKGDWRTNTTQSYRRGYIEGEAGERDVYLLRNGATNLDDYEQGFRDAEAAALLEEMDELPARD